MRRFPLVLTLAAALSPAFAADPASILEQRLAGCRSPAECLERVVGLAFLEQPPPAVKKLCVEQIRGGLGHARSALVAVFPRSSPPDQVTILEIFTTQWDQVSAGVDLSLTDLARRGLESPSAEVRAAAGRFIGTRNLERISHIAIDAAEEHPELRIAALRAIENVREPHGTRWVLEQAADSDPVVRQQALRTIYAIAERAAPFVREFLEDPRREKRNAAIEALLLLAEGDDIPRLEVWLEKHGADDAELAQRVTAAIAAMQSGRYRPTAPPRAPLG